MPAISGQVFAQISMRRIRQARPALVCHTVSGCQPGRIFGPSISGCLPMSQSTWC